MNIYLVSRTDSIGYDEYDAFVVVANTEEEAVSFLKTNHDPVKRYGEWSNEVRVELIGPASNDYTEPTEILGSFNAG